MSEKDKEDPLWWGERLSELGMLIGGSAALEHRLHYGRWYDEDKEICHGKIGIGLSTISLLARIGCAVIRASRPQCPNCKSSLT